MPKHGSINLYVHGNQKARLDGQPRTSTSTLTQLLDYDYMRCIFKASYNRHDLPALVHELLRSLDSLPSSMDGIHRRLLRQHGREMCSCSCFTLRSQNHRHSFQKGSTCCHVSGRTWELKLLMSPRQVACTVRAVMTQTLDGKPALTTFMAAQFPWIHILF